MKRLLFVGVILVIAVGAFRLATAVRANDARHQSGQIVMKQAPDFILKDMEGGRKGLADFKGKIIILDFWATWCPPCRAEIPHFIELQDAYRDQGLEIIGIALDQSEGTVKNFAEKNRINYTILFGDRNVTDLYGGIMSIPTTFVIDQEGNIRKRYIGYMDKEVFEKDIKELL